MITWKSSDDLINRFNSFLRSLYFFTSLARFNSRTSIDFLATISPFYFLSLSFNGRLNASNKALASSFVLALVVIQISKPRMPSVLS